MDIISKGMGTVFVVIVVGLLVTLPDALMIWAEPNNHPAGAVYVQAAYNHLSTTAKPLFKDCLNNEINQPLTQHIVDLCKTNSESAAIEEATQGIALTINLVGKENRNECRL